jgi:hypothetical protein
MPTRSRVGRREPPPDFKPDGTSLIAPPGKVKWPDLKIIDLDGKTYTPEERLRSNILRLSACP